MFVRDFVNLLRARKDEAGRRMPGQVVADFTDAEDRGRKQDFMPVSLSSEIISVLIAVRGMDRGDFDPDLANEVLIRTMNSTAKIIMPTDGISRLFSGGNSVFRPLGFRGSGLHLAWVCKDQTNGRWLAEVGLVRRNGAFAKEASRTHALSETVVAVSLAAGAAVGKGRNIVVSDVAYRVSETASWLSFPATDLSCSWLPSDGKSNSNFCFAFFDWEYDLADGTPVGQVDIRGFNRNEDIHVPTPRFESGGCWFRSSAAALGDHYPPPTKTGCVAAFKWTLNPDWDSSDVTSPKYKVLRRAFEYNFVTRPDDLPIGSTWTAINTTPTVSTHGVPQGVSFLPGDVHSASAVTMAWIKSVSALRKFLYRYSCTFVITTASASATQDARLHIVESVDATATGVRVAAGSTIHDDLPNGIGTLARESEGAFPSNGGTIILSAPSPGHSFRGLKSAFRSYLFQSPLLVGFPGGRADVGKSRYDTPSWPLLNDVGDDFWCVVAQRDTLPWQTWVARRNLSAVIPFAVTVNGMLPNRVRITQSGDKLWINGTSLGT